MSQTLVQSDHIDPDRAMALAGLLDRADVPQPEDALPPLWHLIYFLPRPAQGELGPDGHPREGYPTPPRPGMRRMFAGGRVTMVADLRVGDDAVATTQVVASTDKQGRSGPLRFVTTRTEVTVDDRLVIADERDIVYREPAGPEAALATTPPAAADASLEAILADATAHRRVDVDPTLLFRFSALTYNAHRIHYDAEYARSVEGHAGLVVHGPLQALLMAELAGTMRPWHGATFAYRLRSPLYLGQGMVIVARGDGEVLVVDDTGRTTAAATIEPAES